MTWNLTSSDAAMREWGQTFTFDTSIVPITITAFGNITSIFSENQMSKVKMCPHSPTTPPWRESYGYSPVGWVETFD